MGSLGEKQKVQRTTLRTRVRCLSPDSTSGGLGVMGLKAARVFGHGTGPGRVKHVLVVKPLSLFCNTAFQVSSVRSLTLTKHAHMRPNPSPASELAHRSVRTLQGRLQTPTASASKRAYSFCRFAACLSSGGRCVA